MGAGIAGIYCSDRNFLLKLLPLPFDFEYYIYVFFPKIEGICLRIQNIQNPAGFFSILESDALRRQILTQNPTTIRFLNTKIGWSLHGSFNHDSKHRRHLSMRWMVTRVYAGVGSSSTRSRRAARFFLARLQSAGTSSGLGTNRSALGPRLFIDTYS